MGLSYRIENEVKKKYRKYNPSYIKVVGPRYVEFDLDEYGRCKAEYLLSEGLVILRGGPEDDFYNDLELYWKPHDDPQFGVKPCCEAGMAAVLEGNSVYFSVKKPKKVARDGSSPVLQCGRCRKCWWYDNSQVPAKWIPSD
ncbi:hypothetical protein GCM10009091_49300 [Pseudomonas brenneri]|nr:hypothetical protein GCM10009091_49300 [Pseudomonas brenneri]